MKRLFVVTLFFFISCGNSFSSSLPFTAQGGGLLLSVKGAENAQLSGKRAVARYRITVSGPGISEPLQREIEGSAAEAVIDGIPAGESRVIALEAINADGTIVRSGEALGIAIFGGEMTSAEVHLAAHPLVLNINDGNAIENTRLILRIASDPGDSIAIQSESASGDEQLIDASTSLPTFALDSSSGEGTFAPALIAPGTYRLTVRSLSTDKSTTVNFVVLDGWRRRGAPLYAAGRSEVQGERSLTAIAKELP